jgi:hypothetical protein
VRFPVRGPKPSVLERYADAAIDDRDQVAIRSEVQRRAGPWAIDTGEEDVAVERGAKAVVFDDA